MIRLPGAGLVQGEVGGEGVHRGDEVRRGVDARQNGLVGAPLLLAETHEGREVVVAPLVLIGEDVLVEPVPVEVVGGVAAVALLPLVGDHARVDALALVEIEVGVDAGLERQPLGELQLEALIEVALIVFRAVGGVFHLCQRALLALEYAGQRAVGVVEVEIGAARQHRGHQLPFVDAVLLGVAQRYAAVERQPVGGRVVGVDTGRQTLEIRVGDDTALVVVARRSEVFHPLRAAGDAQVHLVFLGPLEKQVLIVVVNVERCVQRVVDQLVAGVVNVARRVVLMIGVAQDVELAAVGARGLREFVGEFSPGVEVFHVDARSPLLTALGRDEDDAVGRTRTVHGGRRGVLEDLDRGDVAGVDAVDVLHRDSVHHVERLHALGREGRDTADVDLRAFARLSRTCGDLHAGDLSLQRLEDVRGGAAFDGFRRNGGDGARHVAFAHRAVGDDHHFVDLLGVGVERDLQKIGVRGERLGHISDEGYLDGRPAFRERKREFAVCTGHRAVRRARLDYGRADEGLAVTFDSAREGEFPPPTFLGDAKSRLQQRCRQQDGTQPMNFRQ